MNGQITPCLWFDNEAEEATNFYISVFKNSAIQTISRMGSEGRVLVVSFSINGQPFTALNGGPYFTFNEAVSFQVYCDTQDEIDHYWYKLSDGGAEGQCGWLKDKYGVSWQIVPAILPQLMSDPAKAGKVTAAFMQMTKFDIAALLQA